MAEIRDVYALCVGALLLITIIYGYWLTGRTYGALFDDRRKISLSRFQIVLWSLLVLSAFAAAAIEAHSADIVVPENVWALMGITVGSAAGSSLLKSAPALQNKLSRNTEDAAGSLRDILETEAKAAMPTVDIGKLQMLLITLAVWASYAYALWEWKLATHGDSMPEISGGVVTLIGISHAGYLTVKGEKLLIREP
ncbi:MAG: hypothetical protein AAGC92_08115 [Pseudomonadota bacterium]